MDHMNFQSVRLLGMAAHPHGWPTSFEHLDRSSWFNHHFVRLIAILSCDINCLLELSLYFSTFTFDYYWSHLILGWRFLCFGEQRNSWGGTTGEPTSIQGAQRIKFPHPGCYTHERIQSRRPSLDSRWEKTWRLHALVFAWSYRFLEWLACCISKQHVA